jgi:Mn-dependent DtxR family transcriptional regulator
MDDRLKFSEQMVMLNHLKKDKLISMMEYEKIKLFIKRKYKIGIYALE